MDTRTNSIDLYLSKHTTNLVQPSNLIGTYEAHATYDNDGTLDLPASLGNGLYYWTLVAKNSAGSTKKCNSALPSYISVTGSSADAEFSAQVYPNPATDVINVSMANIKENLRITILDTRGQIVKFKTVPKLLSINGLIESVELDNLLPGTYYLNIKGAKTNYSSTFIKK